MTEEEQFVLALLVIGPQPGVPPHSKLLYWDKAKAFACGRFGLSGVRRQGQVLSPAGAWAEKFEAWQLRQSRKEGQR